MTDIIGEVQSQTRPENPKPGLKINGVWYNLNPTLSTTKLPDLYQKIVRIEVEEDGKHFSRFAIEDSSEPIKEENVSEPIQIHDVEFAEKNKPTNGSPFIEELRAIRKELELIRGGLVK